MVRTELIPRAGQALLKSPFNMGRTLRNGFHAMANEKHVIRADLVPVLSFGENDVGTCSKNSA